jgi:serine/threonine protein kinase
MTWKAPGYVAERLIGYGSSSEVWAGRSTRTNQAVALKKVAIASSADARAVRGEAALLQGLDHPNLIRLHDLAEVPGALVLVLDLADAGSLDELLVARGRLIPGEVASALAPIGAALAAAHAKQVIHCDVSAANVLFASNGLPLLSDLGMARVHSRMAADVDPTALIRCTPAYVAPEVAAGGIYQPPGDVFSLAAVAAHAIIGSPVWAGATSSELFDSARRGELIDLRIALERAAVPSEMSSLLISALAIAPQSRPSAADFALWLRFAVELTPVELAAGGRRPIPQRPQGGRHRAQVDGVAQHPGRPRFERVTSQAPDRGQLTHGVQLARVEPYRRPWWRRRVPRFAVAAVMLALIGCVGAAATIDPFSQDRQPVHGAAERRSPPSSAPRSLPVGAPTTSAAPTLPSVPPSSRTVSPAAASDHATSATGAQPSDAELSRTLAELDLVRQEAFAQRRPDLLDQLYSSADLRARDTATILGLVPSGCGLIGVRTTYTQVHRVSGDSESVVLNASAELAPSTLRCGIDVMGSADGLGSTALQITLVPATAGYRIERTEIRRAAH